MPEFEEKKVKSDDVDLNDEFDSKDIEEVVTIENDDDLNANISLEDVQDLTEEEAIIVAQKIEVEIEKYEDILVKVSEEFLTEEDAINLGFDVGDYERLKELDKAIYSHLKSLRKNAKSKGFFANLPWWVALLGIVCAIFNIVPVSPYFPIIIYENMYSKFSSDFMLGYGGAYVFYFGYTLVFFIPEIIIFIISLVKAIKNREKMPLFKCVLIVFIINIIIFIPSLIIFLNSILS